MAASILDYLEESAVRVPNKTAFYDDRESLTFSQLRDKAKRIGSCVATITPPRSPVALLLDSRSIRNLPAMLGVLYAGCAYAPLDLSMPLERLKQLLTLLQPACVLTDEKGQNALSGLKTTCLRYEDAVDTPIQEALLRRIREGASVYDPMSILYTSGSTGMPKGSVQTHFSYLQWTQATVSVYGLDEKTRFANQSPFFYANSILEIFPPLALGATVYLLPAGVLTFPRRMLACLNEQHITCLCMTPSSFISIAGADVLSPGCLPELKWGIMSGESMPWPPLALWMQASPNACWWHFYGSTEMFSVAVGKVDASHAREERLPVGRPFPLAHILFLDEDGREAAPGEPGEMYLSSPWIALGYHRDVQHTEACWVTDPLHRGWYERFYRSGDMGYLRPDGQLMVLGRKDLQIKHRGYRMELGEVEAALWNADGVREGCILYDREQDRIFCFYTGEAIEKDLRRQLSAGLARYMLPDVFLHLEEMPHTASMKVDRLALKERMNQQ